MPLDRFTQQPSDKLYYDFDFTAFLDARADTATAQTALAEAGLTLLSSALVGKKVRVYVTGGVSRRSYKVTVGIDTAGGLHKEAEALISVLDT